MRQRLIYILKHYAFIQRTYRIVLNLVFRLWGKFLKTDDSCVLFVSFMGMNFNDSPKVIYDYMKEHSDYQKYNCIWAFEHPERFPGLNTVRIDSFKYFKTALKAKYWVTNTNIERGLSFKKKDQIYLNTWHGIALKHIGNDCPGRKDYDFSTMNILVVSGKYDERIWKSAFNADDKSYLRCGMPRNEILWHADNIMKAEMKKKLGIPADKKVILYAPTWRESNNGGKSYDIKPPINFINWKKELEQEYIILFRAHHQTTKVLEVEFNDFIRDVSSYPAVNDLMIAADILITDYSAIAFDYSILCRPILCFAYDYETYLKSRGTYFDIDEKYPSKSCRNETELLNRIKGMNYEEECFNTKRFRDMFIEYGVGATEQCVKRLLKFELNDANNKKTNMRC